MTLIIIKALQVLLALTILVTIHELGHFFFAKLFHIKVDKFFIFFDAYNFKLLSTKHGWFSKICPKKWRENETEYGIGWLPLGGYCKINGMVDESLDTKESSEPKPWEFRSKKPWQRFWVLVGGVLFNFIFAIILYIAILNIWGQSFLNNKGQKIYVNQTAYDLGFRNGDEIISMDDYVPENFSNLQADLVRQKAHKVRVLRGKDTVSVYIDENKVVNILNSPNMFQLALPFVIDSISPTSINYQKGLKKRDRIVKINNQDCRFVQDVKTILKNHSDTQLDAVLIRDNDSINTKIYVDSAGMMQVFIRPPVMETKKYNTLTAIPAGIKLTYTTIKGYIDDLKLVAQPSTGAYKSVGSFISIGKIFPDQWHWYSFLYILALLSIMLGVMNLLPIPALDGGHIVFVFYEMITGRKPSEKFLTVAQIIGMIILGILMLYACGNDIFKLIK